MNDLLKIIIFFIAVSLIPTFFGGITPSDSYYHNTNAALDNQTREIIQGFQERTDSLLNEDQNIVFKVLDAATYLLWGVFDFIRFLLNIPNMVSTFVVWLVSLTGISDNGLISGLVYLGSAVITIYIAVLLIKIIAKVDINE